jgi:hypothetical protein
MALLTATQARRRLTRRFQYASTDQINQVVESLPRIQVSKALIPSEAVDEFIDQQQALFDYKGYDQMGGVR